jgi:hypothetical protein
MPSPQANRWYRRSHGAAAAVCCVLGCASPKKLPERYPISINIDAGPNRPVAGATVHAGTSELGTSDAEGRVNAVLSGLEGQVLELSVECPDGHRSPDKALAVTLRAVAETDRRPEYHARCEPLLKTLVVAVRAEHGPNLPVLYLGREVARTDRDGAAHVLLRRPAEDTVELTLDTHEHPELRPRNPSARFQVGFEDEVVAFEPPLQLPKPPKKRAPRPAPGIVNLSARR